MSAQQEAQLLWPRERLDVVRYLLWLPAGRGDELMPRLALHVNHQWHRGSLALRRR